MTAKLYHIYIQPKSGVSEETVKAKMNLSIDWYKYSDTCWVVKTTSDAAKWQARLKPLVEPDGSLLILRVDPTDRQGWIAKSFWAWLRGEKKKDSA
ncbi:hypothetical protein WS51_12670 [Burkholderia territorii]|uniref:hypothetical protein n=1 Tax=Burkholderia territorii TaxID=1503055 RepID=UPI000841860B|nr:hypothetical protein [Burkholderia territorii]AOI64537.1 hypothetical protein WS51_12670 [Burkholderia territorii]